MAGMKSAIAMRDVTFRYGERVILRNVSLDFREKAFTVVLGRNGSGKSTLIKLLAGILPLQDGSLHIQGVDRRLSSHTASAKAIGYLGQQMKLAFPFSVRDLVLTGRAGHVLFAPGTADERSVDQAIDEVGIRDIASRLATEISGGELQLVRLARLLAQDAPLLLLDEPITHLDIAHQVQIMKLLRQIVDKGKTVVAVLHDPSLAIAAGDEFVFVKEGTIEKHVQKERAADPDYLQSIYGCAVHSISIEGGVLIGPKL